MTVIKATKAGGKIGGGDVDDGVPTLIVDTTPDDKDIRTLLIHTVDEDIVIEIPAHYKVTYGPFTPGSKGGYAGGTGNTPALRIYEGPEKQRACFLNVLGFRDLGLPMKVMPKEHNVTVTKHGAVNAAKIKVNKETFAF